MGDHPVSVNPCVYIKMPWVSGAPWVLPWVAPGQFPRMIRKPVAGATPLEGPGTSGRRCPLNPGMGDSPLGYDGSIERPLTSEGPIQSSPDPQGSGVRESAS